VAANWIVLPPGVPARYRCSGVDFAAEEQPMKPDPSDHPEPFPRERIPPGILEWARQTLDEEEFLAHLREMEVTGGHQLEGFLGELEARAIPARIR
jgi:hypothetical protein